MPRSSKPASAVERHVQNHIVPRYEGRDTQMVDDATERVLWIWTVCELALLVVVLWYLWNSVFGASGFLSSVSRQVRLGALAFVVVELLVPLWVFLDLHKRDDESGTMWAHVSAMPFLNLFGLVAYLDYRRRSSGE